MRIAEIMFQKNLILVVGESLSGPAARLARKYGARTLTLENTERAIDALATFSGEVALVLTELRLFELSALRLIRALAPTGARLVALVDAGGGAGTLAAGRRLTVLRKPCDWSAIESIVQEAFENPPRLSAL